MKNLIITAAACFGAAALTILSPTSAWAGTGGCYFMPGNVGVGCFEDYGEIFKARDTVSDGHSVVTQWKVGSSSTVHSLWDHNGAGNGWVTNNSSIAEGTKVIMRFCVGEYGDRSIISCYGWYDSLFVA